MNSDLQLNGNEPAKSGDDRQREELGPRGVPGAPDPAKMTPQREEDAEERRSWAHCLKDYLGRLTKSPERECIAPRILRRQVPFQLRVEADQRHPNSIN